MIMKNLKLYLGIIVIILILAGCATMPKPNEVKVPKPIEGNSGKIMCPYTSDGTVTPWVEKGIYAKVGAAVGKYAGRKAGEKALSFIPFIGGALAEGAGEAAGREIAIELIGGRDYMKETSDLSFNKIDDLIVYLYANYTTNEHWKKVEKLTNDIYPQLRKRWTIAIKKARKP